MSQKYEKYDIENLGYKEKKAFLKQEDDFLQERIKQKGKVILKDTQTVLLSVATFYLSYRLTKKFFKTSSKPSKISYKKEEKEAQQREKIVSEKPSFFSIIRAKAIGLAADILIDQIKDAVTSQKDNDET